MAITICLSKVQDSAGPQHPAEIDWIGFVTFSGSLFMLVYALVQGNAKGWQQHGLHREPAGGVGRC